MCPVCGSLVCRVSHSSFVVFHSPFPVRTSRSSFAVSHSPLTISHSKKGEVSLYFSATELPGFVEVPVVCQTVRPHSDVPYTCRRKIKCAGIPPAHFKVLPARAGIK